MNLDDFLSWLNLSGVNTEYVNVSYSNKSGFGLYARQTFIEKDFLILSIPENLFIKPLFEKDDLTGFEHLIIYLLEEKTNPYINFLRTIDSIPQWQRFPNDKYPQKLMDKMKKHLNKSNQSQNKIQQYENDEFQWAYYTINTRCVHFDMEIDSKDPDDNLCLIPYLDFVNHSIQPNTISKFNQITRSYEIRTIKPIDFNEQITFLYNPHSNVDLFIEYGFVLPSNPYNQLNLEYDLQQILSNEQIQLLKSYNYWNSLEFYLGDNDLSWTIFKAIELNINQDQWSPYDDPPSKDNYLLINKLKQFLSLIQQNLDQDFQLWKTDQFITEKSVLYKDFVMILHDTSMVIDKSILVTYIFFHILISQIEFKCRRTFLSYLRRSALIRTVKTLVVPSSKEMSLKLGEEFPNFQLKTTTGDLQLHDWLGDKWGILFSHPADYTPVCTTELSRAAKLAPEFTKRNTKLIALSCDSVDNHQGWIKDLQAYGDNKTLCSAEFPFPIIEDSDRKLAKQLGMIDPAEFDTKGLPLTARAVFFIGPDKKVKASLLYPATSGRNFDEILRLLDSLQLSARLPIATPVDWKVGDRVMVPPNVKDEDIIKHFPQGVEVRQDLPSGKGYIRTAQV